MHDSLLPGTFLSFHLLRGSGKNHQGGAFHGINLARRRRSIYDDSSPRDHLSILSPLVPTLFPRNNRDTIIRSWAIDTLTRSRDGERAIVERNSIRLPRRTRRGKVVQTSKHLNLFSPPRLKLGSSQWSRKEIGWNAPHNSDQFLLITDALKAIKNWGGGISFRTIRRWFSCLEQKW